MEQARKGKRLGRTGLALAWGWMILIVGYVSWGSATERGLYGWLMRWQLEGGESYSGTFTFALPIVILGLPSIWTLFGHFQAVEEAAAGNADAERRYMRVWALWMLGLAGASAAVALACGVLAAMQPGYERPTEIHASELTSGRVTEGHLEMMAHPEPAARYQAGERRRFGEVGGRSWAGYRAEGEPVGSDAPIALFTEGHAIREDEGTRLADTVQINGYPVRDGLPRIAREAFEARGIRIAEPHYMLRREPEGTNWMTGFALGLFGAFVLGFVGGAIFLKSEGKLGIGPGEAIR